MSISSGRNGKRPKATKGSTPEKVTLVSESCGRNHEIPSRHGAPSTKNMRSKELSVLKKYPPLNGNL